MKKIIFVIDSLNVGGAEKSLISLLNNIDLNKYKISLLILSKNQQLIHQIPECIEILPIPEIILNLYKPLFSDKKNIKLLYKRLRFALQNRVNKKYISSNNILYWEIFSSFFETINQSYQTAIGWGQGIPVLFVIDKIIAKQKIGWFNAEYLIETKFQSKFKEYFKNLDHIVAVSDVLANKLKYEFPYFKNKIKVIYDIIDINRIKSQSNKQISFVYPEDKTKILTIARLDKRKGLELAIKTAHKLKEKINFIWYVIGEGDERKKLENIIHEYNLQDCFKLLGSIENPYPFLKMSDIYVQTSLSEGYCLTLTEAKFFNLPIVTTDFPTAFHQIKNGINGCIVKKDPEKIGTKILMLVEDTDVKYRLIENLSKEKKGNSEEINKFYNLI